ncbi:MAG: hypothetical protein ACLFTT_10500 [Candidatus Hydrogenedentota bacterium]
MKSMNHKPFRTLATAAATLLAAVALTGCPYFLPGIPVNPEYDAGFAVGFAEDGWYWDGYYDGFDTESDDPIYYDTSDIPYIDEDTYDAGYWDGVWYAYNDGYFVDYDYAFTIGFSEGYDVAFASDWPLFLAEDRHIEYANGGWGDGYEDGFSEGRILGAYDYAEELPFDWFDAMRWYRESPENNVSVVDDDGYEIGTGPYGPVELYEYGVDPLDAKSARVTRKTPDRPAPAVRGAASTAKVEVPDISFRPLSSEAAADLDVQPDSALRSDRPLTLESTWLERVEAYRSYVNGAKRAVAPRPRGD